MKTVEQVLIEPSPATVNYRTVNTKRSTPQALMDSKAFHHIYSSNVAASAKAGPLGTKLNWKKGVFVPCLLNIWGVIIFLRLGWIVGQAGLILSTLIVVGAQAVTLLTALSLCAICTNGEVKGGGAYFLISRALGPVFGGTIGILLFVAQAIATSFYIIGFAESVSDLIVSLGGGYFTGTEINDIRVIGIGTCVLLLILALIGIGWYAKTQMGLLVVLVAAILSVFVGAFFPKVPKEHDNELAGFVGFDGGRNFASNFQLDPTAPDVKQSFFTVFAVFFPTVSGFMAGANLSGDLENPSIAIPKGTLWAMFVTFWTYIGLVWFIGLTCLNCVNPLYDPNSIDNDSLSCGFNKLTSNLLDKENFIVPSGGLLYNKFILKNVSVFEPLIYIGVFAATLSSGLAALVGAPRILQSLANDKLFPFEFVNFFSVGHGKNNEPVRAYFLTFAIGVGCVAIGKLDTIAPIITNFFMITFALTNYACFASSTSKAPNWRPSFKYYNAFSSGFGAVLCILVMFLIDWIPALITCTITGVIMYYLYRLQPVVNWGEAGEARKYTKALEGLETLQMSEKVHVKTFRPQFLVLTGDIYERIWLVKFISMLQHGGGLMVCGDIVLRSKVVGESNDKDDNGQIETAKELAMDLEVSRQRRALGETFLESREVWGSRRCKGAFYDAVVSSSFADGFQRLLQLSGIGKMRPNTVVLGFKSKFYQDPIEDVAEFEKVIRTALAAHIGLLVVRDDNNIFDLNMKKSNTNFNLFNFAGIIYGFGANESLDDNDKNEEPAAQETLFQESLQQEVEPERVRASSKNVINMNFDPPSAKERQESDLSMSLRDNRAGKDEDQPADGDGEKLKERMLRYKANDVDYMAKFEANLGDEVKGDRIDVWWLADDGGLTMLLPDLLVQNAFFKDKKLRVMTVTSTFHNVEETSRLKKTELRMIHLLNKFRIDASTHGVQINLDKGLKDETKKRFKKVLGFKMEELDNHERNKSVYHLKLAEEIHDHSYDASTVFVILPIPDTTLRTKLYTSWLYMYSHKMPPMIMMRGNNENVLTFFC